MTQLELRQDDVSLGQEAQPTAKPSKPAIVRGLTAVAIVVLSGFLLTQGWNLWQEWTMLQQEVNFLQGNAFIGYPEIAPEVSYAISPDNWYQNTGKETLLWSRWEKGTGHVWFHFAPGDLEKTLLIRPSYGITSRAIDRPVVETDGGTIWQRIPANAPVVGHAVGVLRSVYPVHVLSKVQVINDVVDDHPFVIAMNLLAPAKEAVSIFEANLNGRRVTMAPSGYFNDGRPLLFDRGTQSLWIEKGDVLKSLAGKYKGRELALVARPTPVSWNSWLAQNPRCRLVVGADRSQAVPSE